MDQRIYITKSGLIIFSSYDSTFTVYGIEEAWNGLFFSCKRPESEK